VTNNRFASVQLTLLSVIVALVLENLLNQVTGGTANTPLMWLQAALIAITVITVWSGFALILTVSDRQPAPVDFICPFGLLVSLTLAAGQLGAESLLPYFVFIAASSLFAIWALNAERIHVQTKEDGRSEGIRKAVILQCIDAALAMAASAVLLLTTPPLALALIIICLCIAIQIIAAVGTMQGWRFVAFSEESG